MLTRLIVGSLLFLLTACAAQDPKVYATRDRMLSVAVLLEDHIYQSHQGVTMWGNNVRKLEPFDASDRVFAQVKQLLTEQGYEIARVELPEKLAKLVRSDGYTNWNGNLVPERAAPVKVFLDEQQIDQILLIYGSAPNNRIYHEFVTPTPEQGIFTHDSLIGDKGAAYVAHAGTLFQREPFGRSTQWNTCDSDQLRKLPPGVSGEKLDLNEAPVLRERLEALFEAAVQSLLFELQLIPDNSVCPIMP